MKKVIAVAVILVLSLLFGLSRLLSGEEQETVAVVLMVDGSEYAGRVAAFCETFLVLEDGGGIQNVPFTEISRIRFEKRNEMPESVPFKPAPTRRSGWHIMGYDLQGTRYFPYPSDSLTGNLPLVELFSLPGRSARTGDITGDGRLELIINTGRSIRVFDGNATQLGQLSLTTEISPHFALGDVTGDGILEVILGRYERGEVYSARSYNFSGRMVAEYRRTGGAHDNSLTPFAVADLDGDGLAEIILSWRDAASRTSSLFAMEPANRLSKRYEFDVEDEIIKVGAVVDVNGDGSMEIIVGRYERGRQYSAAAYTPGGRRLVKYARSDGVRDNSLTPLALLPGTPNAPGRLIAQAGSGYGRGFRGVVIFNILFYYFKSFSRSLRC